MLGSVPTALLWYGYYKFSVEEELFQDELRREGRATGFGGYGTLFPFVYGAGASVVGEVLHVPGSEALFTAASLWIFGSQVNLYRRVNELCAENGEPPLHPWWCFLPPPIDVVVGLRQVHFLAKYWTEVRALLFALCVLNVCARVCYAWVQDRPQETDSRVSRC